MTRWQIGLVPAYLISSLPPVTKYSFLALLPLNVSVLHSQTVLDVAGTQVFSAASEYRNLEGVTQEKVMMLVQLEHTFQLKQKQCCVAAYLLLYRPKYPQEQQGEKKQRAWWAGTGSLFRLWVKNGAVIQLYNKKQLFFNLQPYLHEAFIHLLCAPFWWYRGLLISPFSYKLYFSPLCFLWTHNHQSKEPLLRPNFRTIHAKMSKDIVF